MMSALTPIEIGQETLANIQREMTYSGNALIASHAGIDGSLWSLRLEHGLSQPEMLRNISELFDATHQSNPFLHPGFLKSAIQGLQPKNLSYLCLYEAIGPAEKLKLFIPVLCRRMAPLRKRVLLAWSHEYGPLSTPLMHGGDVEKTLEEFSNCLTSASSRKCDAIIFENLPTYGPFAETLFRNPRLSAQLTRVSAIRRAAIIGKDSLNSSKVKGSGKRKQRLRKAREWLQELGEVSFSNCREGQPISQFIEAHTRIEDAGWKGRRGTAVDRSEKTRAFFTSAVTEMVEAGRCRFYTLSLNGETIASMVVLNSHGCYYPWKIAFDENYAAYSIGNQLLVYVNSMLAEKADDFQYLDSLADPLNKTANRFWPHKLDLHTTVIGVGKKATANMFHISEFLRYRNRLRDFVRKFRRGSARS